jgi:hypothetical protein
MEVMLMLMLLVPDHSVAVLRFSQAQSLAVSLMSPITVGCNEH